MKITTTERGFIRLEEVFLPVEFQTSEGEELSVVMRDSGFEVYYKLRMYEFKGGVLHPVKSRMRAGGNTTRQIDAAVQTLFDKGAVFWQDHAAVTSGKHVNTSGFNILLRRLDVEHEISEEAGNLRVDRNKWWIALK